jgi:hypothetical protein
VQPGQIVDQLIYLVNFKYLRNILTSISAFFTASEIHCVLKRRFVEKPTIPLLISIGLCTGSLADKLLAAHYSAFHLVP